METVKFTNSSRLYEASFEPHSGKGENEIGTLYVTFQGKNHSRYQYFDVPRIDWVRLAITEQTHDSPGKAFERYIKGRNYAYEKLS